VSDNSMPHRVIESQEWRWVYISSALLLVMLSIPFLWAYAVAGPDRTFTGILVNPVDGMSYQAKMAEGATGTWLFDLPYTPEPHRGVFLFTFYMALGQLAALLNIEQILVFHVIRLIGGLFLFLSIYRFVADWTDSVEQRRIAWGLAIVGAGFGWIALAFGFLTPDILVPLGGKSIPEAFPLQAVYANAHYPWAIAAAAALGHLLIIGALVDPLPWEETTTPTLALGASTIILVSLSPFVLATISIGYGAMCLWLWLRSRVLPRRALVWGLTASVFALPLALYSSWAISAQNPVFYIWIRQVHLPVLTILDYIVAFGPLLLLALVGLIGSRRHLQAGDVFLLGWIAGSTILLIAPIGLQQRFTTGLLLPVSVYASRGLWRVLVPAIGLRWRFATVLMIFALIIPTTVLSVVLPLVGATNTGDSYTYFYVTVEEGEALNWLREHATHDDVVLASPSMSLFVPAYGPKVVYGHPFETLNPEARKAQVETYYAGEDCTIVDTGGVDYIVVGDRERQLPSESSECLPQGEPVFRSSSGGVEIFRVESQ
jgi:hypothetical protein